MEEKSKKELPKKEFYEKLDVESRNYEAEKELYNMDERKDLIDHDHEFTLQTGNRAYCNCGWGIYLDNKDSVKEGHLYRDGTLIM